MAVGLSAHSVYIALILVVSAAAYSMMCRTHERSRLALTGGMLPQLISVWLFAGAVLLPAPLMLATVVAVFAADWPTYRIVSKQTPYRFLYTAATILIAAAACRAVMHAVSWGVLLTPVVYIACNSALIAAAVASAGQYKALRQMVRLDLWVQELLILAMGAATAVAMAEFGPLAGLASGPVVLVVHSIIVARHMREDDVLDPETETYREPQWRALAEHGLLESGRLGLLMVRLSASTAADLRHAVAVLRSNSRAELDFVGRYDTDIVALAMPGVRINPLGVVRRNVTAALSAAGISTAVSVAACEMGGADLPDALMHALSQLIVLDVRADRLGLD